MKTLRWLLLLVVTFAYGSIMAQAKLGFIIDSFATTIAWHDTTAYMRGITIKNYGTTTFTDTVRLQYMVNDTLYSGSIQNVGFYLKPDTTNLVPGATVRKELVMQFNVPNFMNIGSSVVVIWPISGSALAFDSSTYTVQVVDSTTDTLTSGIPATSNQNLQVFISHRQLQINTNAQNYIKRLSLYNSTGQLLINQNLSSPTTLSMAPYATGYYLVELTLFDDSRKVFKIVNTAAP